MPSAVSIGVIIAVLENSPYFRYTIRKRGDRMFLQYYVTESTTGNRSILKSMQPPKLTWMQHGTAGRQSGTQISSLTLKRKSMQPKPKMVRSSRWEPIVSGKEALPFTLPILRASQKATQLSGTQKIFRHRQSYDCVRHTAFY